MGSCFQISSCAKTYQECKISRRTSLEHPRHRPHSSRQQSASEGNRDTQTCITSLYDFSYWVEGAVAHPTARRSRRSRFGSLIKTFNRRHMFVRQKFLLRPVSLSLSPMSSYRVSGWLSWVLTNFGCCEYDPGWYLRTPFLFLL
jgi:hypothetical protein